jgi:hypothetical protein
LIMVRTLELEALYFGTWNLIFTYADSGKTSSTLDR